MGQQLDKRSFLLEVLTNPGQPIRVNHTDYEVATKDLIDEIKRLKLQAKVLQKALDSIDTK